MQIIGFIILFIFPKIIDIHLAYDILQVSILNVDKIFAKNKKGRFYAPTYRSFTLS